MWVRVPSASPNTMKLIELARVYKCVNDRFFIRFQGAEIVAEHDELFIHLAEPINFSEEEREYLEDLGLYSEEPYPDLVTYFSIYL